MKIGFKNMQHFKEIDHKVIDEIASNCCIHDFEDCKRLLISQNNDIIEKIYYELMYDKNGDETDFIPLGCTYDKLVEILVKIGGKIETFGEKKKRRARKQLKDTQVKINEYKLKLESIENEYLEKIRFLQKKREESMINQKNIELDFYKNRLRVLHETLKYKTAQQKIFTFEEINKIKNKIKELNKL